MRQSLPGLRYRAATVSFAAALAALMAVAVGASPASAAHWRGISGGTYSDKTWYVGATEHIKSGNGNITIRFSQMPSGGGGTHGIRASVAFNSNGPWMAPQHFNGSGALNESKRLSSGVANGTSFWVSYSRHHVCTWSCNNSFTGQIWA